MNNLGISNAFFIEQLTDIGILIHRLSYYFLCTKSLINGGVGDIEAVLYFLVLSKHTIYIKLDPLLCSVGDARTLQVLQYTSK